MSIYASRHFWEATAERSIKTTAQVTGGLLGADHIVGVLDVEWTQVGSVASLAALLSVLTSIASARIGKGGPSLGGEIVESDVVEWADGREVVEDYRATQLSLRAHPLSFLRDQLDRQGIVRCADLRDIANGKLGNRRIDQRRRCCRLAERFSTGENALDSPDR